MALIPPNNGDRGSHANQDRHGDPGAVSTRVVRIADGALRGTEVGKAEAFLGSHLPRARQGSAPRPTRSPT